MKKFLMHPVATDFFFKNSPKSGFLFKRTFFVPVLAFSKIHFCKTCVLAGEASDLRIFVFPWKTKGSRFWKRESSVHSWSFFLHHKVATRCVPNNLFPKTSKFFGQQPDFERPDIKTNECAAPLPPLCSEFASPKVICFTTLIRGGRGAPCHLIFWFLATCF